MSKASGETGWTMASSRERRPAAVVGILGMVTMLAFGARPAACGQGAWTSIGPYGGTITGLAVAPGEPNTLYASTHGTGIFKSLDGGATWSSASVGLGDPAPQTVAIAPNGGLWAAGEGLWRSRDGGAHWQAVAPPPNGFLGGTQFAFDAATPQTIYLAGAGILKSTDGGVTWSQISTVPASAAALTLAVDPQNPRVLVAGGIQGIARSADAGATWQSVDAGCHCEALLFDPLRPARVFAGCRASVQFQPPVETGVRESLDGGRTWRFSRAGLGALGVYALAAQPGAADTFFAGTSGGGVFRSTDAGAHWLPFNSGAGGIAGATVGTLAAVPAAGPGGEPELFAGTGIAREEFLMAPGIGVFHESGGGWVQANAGLTVAIRALGVDTSGAGRLFAAAPALGVYRTRSGGAIWTQFNAGLADLDVVFLAVSPSAPSHLYVVSNFNALFASTDNGRTFSPRQTQFVPVHTGIVAIAVDPQDPLHILLAAPAMGDSHDGGMTWDVEQNGGAILGADSVAFAPSAPAVAYATGLSETMPDLSFGELFASADGGASWTIVTANPGVAYAVDASDANVLYGYGFSGLAISTDGGATLTPTSLTVPLHCVATRAGMPGVIAACGTGTVWLSRDGGATWTAKSAGLPPQLAVQTAVFDPVLPSALYASTGVGGVFALTF
jgi:photosystem II stability/assembly factor-like uncharacterized protein